MALRHGFKTDANWYARDLRTSLELMPHEPICPWKLSQHLEIPLVPLSDFANEAPVAWNWFSRGKGRDEFSALTICDGPRRCIIHPVYHP